MHCPTMPIIIHGHDYALPYPFGRRDRRKPRWVARDGYFGAVFPHLDIRDNALQTAILHEVINAMNAIQRRLAGGEGGGWALPPPCPRALRPTPGAPAVAPAMH